MQVIDKTLNNLHAIWLTDNSFKNVKYKVDAVDHVEDMSDRKHAMPQNSTFVDYYIYILAGRC